MNSREEILVVVKDQENEQNKVVSFYPYCTIGKLSSIAKTMETGKDLRKLIKRNMLITRIWNFAGSIIAIPMFISAPLINLIGDALSLTFMSNAKNWTERRFAPTRRKQEGSIEGVSKIPWHTKSSEEILEFYKTDAYSGLTTEQVNQTLPLYGKNQLVSKTRPHWINTYFGQFKEFTTQVLGATALLSAFTGHLFDGIIMGIYPS